MIRIQFDPPTNENWTSWIEECRNETVNLIQSVRDGDEPLINDLYKDVRLKEVYISPTGPFFGKCAYCESDIYGDQPGDIEHFRPKRRTTNEDNTPVTKTELSGEVVTHPGYYWLAYDYTNLLVACADCNRPSSFKTKKQVGKWDKFPVVDHRAWDPGDEVNESALLLNPLIDDPDEHIELQATGMLKDKSARGESVIRVLGLNLRTGLIRNRINAIEDVERTLLALVVACHSGNEEDILRQHDRLMNVKLGSTPYAMAGRFAIEHKRADYEPFFEALEH